MKSSFCISLGASLLLTALDARALDVDVIAVEQIQEAVDAVAAAGGGRVLLQPGTYTLSDSIYMTSNVSLVGAGADTVLELPEGANYAMIVDDGTEPLENMSVSNMVLDGKIPESSVSNDPNAEYPQGDSLGIYFDAYESETYHTNVKIEDVELHHLALGIHLKGVVGAEMNDVHSHHNGIYYWPGHNIYLRRTHDVVIRDSVVSDAFNGAGVNVSFSTGIQIYDTMALRNQGRGMRAASTDGFIAHGNTLVGNGDVGLLANWEGYGTTNIDWQDNCIADGGSVGAQALSSAVGVAQNNNSYGNGAASYELPDGVDQSNNLSDPSQPCMSEPVAPGETGAACEHNGHCDSFVCDDRICQPSRCAPTCNRGAPCGSAADCGSGVCSSGRCAAPSCAPHCNTGETCGDNSDCSSFVCQANVCAPAWCAPQCNRGAPCGTAEDCRSGVCKSGRCR